MTIEEEYQSEDSNGWGSIIGWVIGIAVFWFIFSNIGGAGEYQGQSAEDWFNEYDEASVEIDRLNTRIEDFQYALQEANDNIEEANSDIESAKWYSGESYYDMEYALDSLDTVSTVDEP